MELSEVSAALADLRTGSLAHAPDRVRQAALLDIVEALANAVAPATTSSEGEDESSTTGEAGVEEGGTDTQVGDEPQE